MTIATNIPRRTSGKRGARPKSNVTCSDFHRSVWSTKNATIRPRSHAPAPATSRSRASRQRRVNRTVTDSSARAQSVIRSYSRRKNVVAPSGREWKRSTTFCSVAQGSLAWKPSPTTTSAATTTRTTSLGRRRVAPEGAATYDPAAESLEPTRGHDPSLSRRGAGSVAGHRAPASVSVSAVVARG